MNVLQEDVLARTIIRNEALKKIDNDYDVIYDWVKDESIENGATLKSHILKYMSEGAHDSLLNLIPNLTIFIPTLPEYSFAPDLWEVNTQSPIAYIDRKKRIRMIYTNDSCDFYPTECVPGFPVLVVKPNERLVSENSPKASGRVHTRAGNSARLKFIDNCFNNIDELRTRGNDERSVERPGGNTNRPDFSVIEQKLYDAYHVFYGNNLG